MSRTAPERRRQDPEHGAHQAPGIAPSDQDAAGVCLEAARLVSRTVAHHLRNRLTLTVGHCALLADNPELPPALRERAREALRGALAAAETVGRLQRLRRLELDTGPFGDPEQAVLDLDLSCAPPGGGPAA